MSVGSVLGAAVLEMEGQLVAQGGNIALYQVAELSKNENYVVLAGNSEKEAQIIEGAGWQGKAYVKAEKAPETVRL